MSLANGQHEVAELLSKLRPVCQVFLNFRFNMFISYCTFYNEFITTCDCCALLLLMVRD